MQAGDRKPLAAEDENLTFVLRLRRERDQRGREKILPRVCVRAARDDRDEVEIVDDHHWMVAERRRQHEVHRLVERKRVPLRGRLDEVARRQQHAAEFGVQRAEDGGLASALPPGQFCHIVRGDGAFEGV